MTGRLRTLIRAVVPVLVTFPAASLRAQEPLPTAAEILARYHHEVGAAAYAKIKSLHSTGQLDVPAAGISGTLEIWQARPNLTQMHASMPGFGEVRTGFTGTSGWAIDPGGARLLAGAEGIQARDDANFDSHLRTAELIDTMIVIERTTLSGYNCYKVRTVWRSGRETTDCFSTKTGLLVGSIRTSHNGDQASEAVILFEEYREYNGALIPTKITTRVGGVDQIIMLREITLDHVPASAFDPPADVARLISG